MSLFFRNKLLKNKPGKHLRFSSKLKYFVKKIKKQLCIDICCIKPSVILIITISTHLRLMTATES